MRRHGKETILFEREPDTDPFGDPIVGTGVSKEIKGCQSWPSATSEESFRGGDVTDDRVALVPVAPDELGSNWNATLAGRVYKIEGLPQGWGFLSGKHAGTQIKLKYQGAGNA